MADKETSHDSSGVEAQQNQVDEPGPGTNTSTTTPLAIIENTLVMDIALLPPLPTPKYDIKRRELNGGIIFVNILIMTFVGLTHGVALTAVDVFPRGGTVWWIFLGLIYAEAIIALICLVGLALTDPGVVQRSPETCFPLPAQVEPWVQSYVVKQKQKDNNAEQDDMPMPPPHTELYISHPDDDNQDTFCVRCLVWRKSKPRTKYFHCAVCQRCVEYFDHHCSVFGRCIAGTTGTSTWKGNYKYFVAIAIVGMLAYWTTVIALVWSLSVRYGPEWAIPISILVLWFIQVNLISRGWQGMQCCKQCT